MTSMPTENLQWKEFRAVLLAMRPITKYIDDGSFLLSVDASLLQEVVCFPLTRLISPNYQIANQNRGYLGLTKLLRGARQCGTVQLLAFAPARRKHLEP